MKNGSEKPEKVREVVVNINRPALDLSQKRRLSQYVPQQQPDLRSRLVKHTKKQFECSGSCLKSFVKRRVPILDWLPSYKWKQDIIGDVMAGCTVAVVQIPLGMGFALLASIPAICGIYMAFFPVIAYAFLASSRHNSMGAFAIITMMTGKVVNEYATFPSDMFPTDNSTLTNGTEDAVAGPIYTPIQVAMITCFMSGLWSVLLGFFSVGSVTVFFNDLLVSAFSFGSAVHVVTSQIPTLLGLSLKPRVGPMKIIFSYVDIFTHIAESNPATCVVSAIAIFVIATNNEIFRPRLAKITKIVFPIELLVVIVGTTCSYLIDFETTYDIKIVGDIPTGLPMPELPPFSLAGAVALDSLIIAIVAYSGSYSLAKIFGEKHDYPVDAKQELYAMGFGNIFSSFFSCGPMAAAIARNLIQDASGGITQLASLISCFIMLWVLLFIGPVFESLPKACLASIIVVALKSMFLLIFRMTEMWPLSKMDAMIWIVTALGVVLIDVSYGLILGVLFGICVLIYKGQHPKMMRMGQVPNSDVYVESSFHERAVELENIIVVRVDGPLHFANRENFKENLIKISKINLKAGKKVSTNDEMNLANNVLKQPKYLVLDCQGMGNMDALGAKFLVKLRTLFEGAGVTLCLASLSDEATRVLDIMGALDEFKEEYIFYTAHDAITILNDGQYDETTKI